MHIHIEGRVHVVRGTQMALNDLLRLLIGWKSIWMAWRVGSWTLWLVGESFAKAHVFSQCVFMFCFLGTFIFYKMPDLRWKTMVIRRLSLLRTKPWKLTSSFKYCTDLWIIQVNRILNIFLLIYFRSQCAFYDLWRAYLEVRNNRG